MSDVDDHEAGLFRRYERTGRPMGDATFIEIIESLLETTDAIMRSTTSTPAV